MCTMMAGVLLVVLGATSMGSAVRFIPRPVVIGFTNGIAVLIASTQIKDFFGLSIDHVPTDFVGRMAAVLQHWNTISVEAALLALGALALILLTPKLTTRIPGTILALFVGTAAAVVFRLHAETIGT